MRDSARSSDGRILAFRFALVATAVLYVDQITKSLVRGGLAPCSGGICDHLRVGPMWIINTTNSQGAASLGSRSGMWAFVTVLGALLIPVYGKRVARISPGRWDVPLALGLIAGGALGNLVDRVVYGGVTDLLSPSGYVVFNMADVAVVAGTVMTIRLLLRSRRLVAATRIASASRP